MNLLIALAMANPLPPTTTPVFLKTGFSTILQFDQNPSRVVLGDAQAFQVERMKDSLVVRPLLDSATSNLFVYFPNDEVLVFVLKAESNAEPTFLRTFQTKLQLAPKPTTKRRLAESFRVVSSKFDDKKDYLSVLVEVRAGTKAVLPRWGLVKLEWPGSSLAPVRLWSERKEVQVDSQIKARFIFAKPSLPRALQGARLILPLLDRENPLEAQLKGESS